LGKKKKGPYEYRLRWDSVVYEPGELKVVAYKNGKIWAKTNMRTAGEAASLFLHPDNTFIKADGKDLAFITVRVVDSNNVLVPRADNDITFEVSGPGEIVATDNGDPADLRSFASKERKAFNGMALVIVRAKKGKVAKGTKLVSQIVVTARSKGLSLGKAVITSN